MSRLLLGLEFDGELPPKVRAELEQIIAALQAWQVKVSPNDAAFITAASNSELSDERVATNTSTIRWDFGTTGQAKLHAIGGAGGGTGLLYAFAMGDDEGDGGDVTLVPGPTGTQGPAGAAGATGAAVFIEEQTPTGSSVTFSSLGSYTHLEVWWSGRGDQVATSTNMSIQFNGDTGANYDRQLATASASTASASESLGQTSAVIGSVAAASAGSGIAGAGSLRIFDYRGTTFHKVGVSHDGLTRGTASGDVFSRQFVIKWRDTSAITSMTITLASGSFVTGTKFSLYGVS